MSLQKEGKICFTLDGMYDLTCKSTTIIDTHEKKLALNSMHATKLISCSAAPQVSMHREATNGFRNQNGKAKPNTEILYYHHKQT